MIGFFFFFQLLLRVFHIMREKNPDMIAGEKRRFIMRPPQVLRVGTKKTSFANFIEICKMLVTFLDILIFWKYKLCAILLIHTIYLYRVHRQPRHLQAFLLAELGTRSVYFLLTTYLNTYKGEELKIWISENCWQWSIKNWCFE